MIVTPMFGHTNTDVWTCPHIGVTLVGLYDPVLCKLWRVLGRETSSGHVTDVVWQYLVERWAEATRLEIR